MKRIIFFLFVILVTVDIYAQTPSKIIVEHFTNTVCGICSNRNPGFYTNLNNHPDILHIAYHPSSPYSSCLFNMQNSSENDGRTNFYGIYGSTPKLVIQGENVPVSADYGNASIFDDYESQLSPILFELTQVKDNGSDIILNVAVSNTAITDVTDALFFVGIAEDIVNYNAPNGESVHFDVFRKGLTNINGDAFSIAAGESLTYTFTVQNESDWNYSELFAYVIIQDATTKAVIQSSATNKNQNDDITIGIDEVNDFNLSISPNPALSEINVDFDAAKAVELSIYNILGELILTQNYSDNTQIDVNDLATGTYFISLKNEEGKSVKKFIKQ